MVIQFIHFKQLMQIPFKYNSNATQPSGLIQLQFKHNSNTHQLQFYNPSTTIRSQLFQYKTFTNQILSDYKSNTSQNRHIFQYFVDAFVVQNHFMKSYRPVLTDQYFSPPLQKRLWTTTLTSEAVKGALR